MSDGLRIYDAEGNEAERQNFSWRLCLHQAPEARGLKEGDCIRNADGHLLYVHHDAPSDK